MQFVPQPKICLGENNLVQFNEKKNANNFKYFFRDLAPDLVNRLPAAKNIFAVNFVNSVILSRKHTI